MRSLEGLLAYQEAATGHAAWSTQGNATCDASRPWRTPRRGWRQCDAEPTSTQRSARLVKSSGEHMKAIQAIQRSRGKPETQWQADWIALLGVLAVAATLWAFG